MSRQICPICSKPIQKGTQDRMRVKAFHAHEGTREVHKSCFREKYNVSLVSRAGFLYPQGRTSILDIYPSHKVLEAQRKFGKFFNIKLLK